MYDTMQRPSDDVDFFCCSIALLCFIIVIIIVIITIWGKIDTRYQLANKIILRVHVPIGGAHIGLNLLIIEKRGKQQEQEQEQ